MDLIIIEDGVIPLVAKDLSSSLSEPTWGKCYLAIMGYFILLFTVLAAAQIDKAVKKYVSDS